MNNNAKVITPFSQPEQLYAAVDLGSNSFHMVIVRVVAGSWSILSFIQLFELKRIMRSFSGFFRLIQKKTIV